jgi:hypothetical protein
MMTDLVSLSCTWLQEPLLGFADGGRHVDPKEGIARYGPHALGTASHPETIRLGIVSTAELTEQARAWFTDRARGIGGDAKNPRFPGADLDRGYLSAPAFAPGWDESISAAEIREVTGISSQRERLQAAVDLLETKVRLIAHRDRPPDCIVVALPDTFYRRCRVADFYDKQAAGQIHRDLRRWFKATAMRYRIPTQLVRERTITTGDGTPPSKVAWNLFTALYTKAGGRPWAPTDLPPASCFIGIGFYRPLGEPGQVQSSVIQAFDEHGEGLVIRGEAFEWDAQEMGTSSPHLSEEHAAKLTTETLQRYEEVLGQTPRRVVVHKTSRYWPAELAGFQAGVASMSDRADFVALTGQSRFRAVPPSKYPPLRGTRVQVGSLDYLYTTGFVPALGEFHGMHVPAPLEIADHIGGDTSRAALLGEILTLTKLNWNSATLGGRYPITLRFSQLVGDILRELPEGREPLPQFKFYI